MLRRTVRTTLLLSGGAAAGLAGSAVVGWDPSSCGVIRFGRALAAATHVVIDYKNSLSGLDPESQQYEDTISQVHWRSAERLREMCRVNGGCFIKVGQHLAALEYLVPMEYVKTMQVLHSRAPCSDISDVRQVIKEELGAEVEEIFSTFSPLPHGAASLAQVHRATLKDGTPVAVKVQHPKVKGHSAVDISTMEFLVDLVSRVFPDFKFKWLAEATRENLPRELDFVQEADNCERVARMLKPFSFLKVPAVYRQYSTDRVLTMEFCEGGEVNDIQYYNQHHIDKKQVCEYLSRVYSEMIFVHGYVHCDPHPGNVLVHKHGDDTQIVLLDHGLYQTLTPTFRYNYCSLWMSLINRDMQAVKHYATQLHAGDMYELLACMVTARSWSTITSGIDQPLSRQEDASIRSDSAAYLRQISVILNNVPREMLLIFKTNDLVRGIESALNLRGFHASLITTSHSCVHALADLRLRERPESLMHAWRAWCWKYHQLVKISIYSFFLWLQSHRRKNVDIIS